MPKSLLAKPLGGRSHSMMTATRKWRWQTNGEDLLCVLACARDAFNCR